MGIRSVRHQLSLLGCISRELFTLYGVYQFSLVLITPVLALMDALFLFLTLSACLTNGARGWA